MSDNGQPETPKTPEQLAQERLERYQKEPLMFIELTETVCCVAKNEQSPLKLATFINPDAKRSALGIALTELTYRIHCMLNQLDNQKNKIIPAKHGILNFGRGRR